MSAHDLLNLLKRFEEKIILYFFSQPSLLRIHMLFVFCGCLCHTVLSVSDSLVGTCRERAGRSSRRTLVIHFITVVRKVYKSADGRAYGQNRLNSITL